MRQLVLNDSSLHTSDQNTAIQFLLDLCLGIGKLLRQDVVESTLRSKNALSETKISGSVSVASLFQLLRGAGHRDEYVLLMRLTLKSPLLMDADPSIEQLLLGCEYVGVETSDSDQLLLCALTNWVLISFPTSNRWSGDLLCVEFDELTDPDEVSRTCRKIDNLSRSSHAASIQSRHVATGLQLLDQREFWAVRTAIFPNLVFGPHVKSNVERLQVGIFDTVINRLYQLEQVVRDWRSGDDSLPVFRSRVSPERPLAMSNKDFANVRRFRSASGEVELFEWHARYGRNGRIHFRLLVEEKKIEIGYVGKHL